MTEQNAAQSAPVADLSKLTLIHLYDLQQRHAAEAVRAKARFDAVGAEVSHRLSSSAAAAFVQADKEHGTLTMQLQGGLEAKVDITKKVEWDGDKLIALAQTMSWERVTQLFKVAFSISETAYKGIVTAAGFGKDAEAFKEKVDDARTVRFSVPKVTLQKVDG